MSLYICFACSFEGLCAKTVAEPVKDLLMGKLRSLPCPPQIFQKALIKPYALNFSMEPYMT